LTKLCRQQAKKEAAECFLKNAEQAVLDAWRGDVKENALGDATEDFQLKESFDIL
tara:strand:+ start:252 stop:416 length:165 start_codon:yes stop_codon:yes gene_type:complete